MPNIRSKANRNWKDPFSPFLHPYRNAIERMLYHLKEFCRVATRYDQTDANSLATVCNPDLDISRLVKEQCRIEGATRL